MIPAHYWLLSGLLTVSLLWPAEDAVNGAGLHWVLLWLVAGLWIAVRRILQSGVPAGTGRPGLAGTGWCLIVLGQWVSTAMVFHAGGDRRAALNLSLEWLGLLVAAGVWQTGLRGAGRRSQLAAVLVVVMVGVAGYGLWQHRQLYAEQASWYQSLRSELDGALTSPDPSGILRTTEITQELQQHGIPLDGTDRILWEQRLLYSSEPTGTFALANTLSGLLVIALLVLFGSLTVAVPDWKKTGLLPLVGAVVSLVVLTDCLVLTKSRTAWVGGVIGLIWLLISRSRKFPEVIRRLRLTLVAGAVAAGLVVAAGIATGGLDREVILESPRSLQFRLFYWIGTAGVLRESPWFGAGPGNFRQSYLRHKVAESSEEIRDPHNFLLEAWTSGGVISLLGILLCAGGLLRSLTRTTDPGSDGMRAICGVAGVRPRFSGWFPAVGVGLGFMAQSLWFWGNGGEFDTDVARWLGIPVLALAMLVFRLDRIIVLDRVTAQAAVMAVSLHLCGAGGFQMPVVMLLWVWLLLTATDDRPLTDRHPGGDRGTASHDSGRTIMDSVRPWLAGTICLVGLVVVGWCGTMPVMRCQRAVSAGMELQRRGDARSAAAAFDRAVLLDELSPIPRQRRAELETYRLRSEWFRQASGPSDGLRAGMARSGDSASGREFSGAFVGRGAADRSDSLLRQLQTALRACDDWIQADPRNPGAVRARAECRRMGFHSLQDPHQIVLAQIEQQRVTWMYPTSVTDWWRLFEISQDAAAVLGPTGSSGIGRNAAVRALELDAGNHQWGHRDRYLSEDRVSILRRATGKD